MKKLQTLVAAVLVIALCFSITIFPVNATDTLSRYYTDVYSSDSYYSAVNYLYEHGIMYGVRSKEFSPSSELSRGQMVTILWRMLNNPKPSGTVQDFSDCPQNAYYYAAVCWASSSNIAIVAGCGNNRFEPNRAVTYQEALAFLYRFTAYCTYITNSDSSRDSYLNAFLSSSLANKETFSSWTKIPAGWAYQNGLILDTRISGHATETRGEIARQIYAFYQRYQKKYGLAVVNSTNMSYAANCATYMKNLFVHYGASSAIGRDQITKSQFEIAMNEAFRNAKPLDICYLYCASHGGVSGLALFTSNDTLTPAFLRQKIDSFDGTFVVFISGCHSGTFITKSGNGESDVFDADVFTSDILDDNNSIVESGELRGSSRIKVICSSRKEEVSYDTSRNATRFWCLGCGYDYLTSQTTFTTLFADQNKDSRISLEELYQYSLSEILSKHVDQHVVRAPAVDSFVIFESGY